MGTDWFPVKCFMNQTVSIGLRLKEERTRLGMSQPVLAALGGVTKKTQMLYESGERHPDAQYLAAMAQAGVDVLYVLTNTKAATHIALGRIRTASQAAAVLEGSEHEKAEAAEAIFNGLNLVALSQRELVLLENFKAADEEAKKIIEGTAAMAAKPKPSSSE